MIVMRQRGRYLRLSLPKGWVRWSMDRKRWYYLSEDMQRHWTWFFIPSDLKSVIRDYHSDVEHVEVASDRLTFK